MRKRRKGVPAVPAAVLAVVLAAGLLFGVPEPAAAGWSKVGRAGQQIVKEIFKELAKKAEKKRKVERAKMHQRFRLEEEMWRRDCCELLKERIRKKELTIEDLKKIRDFIDWRLPANSVYKRKKFNWKSITQEVGYKIISNELCEFDLQLIYEKIKNPDWKPHWAKALWIAIGDYGRECWRSPMVQPRVIPAPGPGVGM